MIAKGFLNHWIRFWIIGIYLDNKCLQVHWAIHSYDILGARMLWKPKEARILTNFIDQPV
jgi:hypothetical protein